MVAQLHQHQLKASYDEKDAIGRRYRRQDECGTPLCVTVDGETARSGTVTLRDRDTMKQERVPIDGLVARVKQRLE